jgi:membrane associated rhomboid family serine protease
MLTPWVSRIIFANVAIFLAQMFIPGVADASDLLKLRPVDIPVRPWTLLTYAFLHQGFGHIFFNMLVLFMFGPRVEAQLGSKRFVVLYVVSAIGGGLLSFITPDFFIVGASGATLGVMYAFAKYWPRAQIYLFGFVPIEARVAIIVMVVLDLFGGFGGGGRGIAHFAHLGGFLGAFVYLRFADSRAQAARFQATVKTPRPSRGDIDRWARIQRDRLHEVNREEFDRIMQKIEREGVGSVTAQERSFLDNFSERAGSQNG